MKYITPKEEGEKWGNLTDAYSFCVSRDTLRASIGLAGLGYHSAREKPTDGRLKKRPD